MSEKKGMNTGVKIAIFGGIAALAGFIGYQVFKPKKTDTDMPSGTGDISNEPPKKETVLDKLTNVLNVGNAVYNQYNKTPEGYSVGVAYVAPRNEGGKITDASVMEIRFKTDTANFRTGDSITLKNTPYDATYTIIGKWGSDGKMKTAYVKKTTNMTVNGISTPNGTATLSPAAVSFAGITNPVF